jgi:hypothetical protein
VQLLANDFFKQQNALTFWHQLYLCIFLPFHNPSKTNWFMSIPPPIHRRITTLTDVRVELSADGQTVQRAFVRLSIAERIDLFDCHYSILENCSPAVADHLYASVKGDEDPVKLGIYCAILWWERYWTCDSEWEMLDGHEHWDPVAIELLERLFI